MSRIKLSIFALIVIVLLANFLASNVRNTFLSLFNGCRIYLHAWERETNTVWLRERNNSRSFSLCTNIHAPVIVDAKGYEYSGGKRYYRDIPESSFRSSCDYLKFNSATDGGQGGVPPGGVCLVDYTYADIPANAPEPWRLIYKAGPFGMFSTKFNLDKPKQYTPQAIPKIKYSPVLYKKKDVKVFINRAWWDEPVVVVEVRVENDSGKSLNSSVLPGVMSVWGYKIDGLDWQAQEPDEEFKNLIYDKLKAYKPLIYWTVPPYTHAFVYYLFVPWYQNSVKEELKDNLILSIHTVGKNLSWLIPRLLYFDRGYSYSLKEYHITSLNLIDTPVEHYANDPELGPLIEYK